MEANCPLPDSILHLDPQVGAIVKEIHYFDAVPTRGNRLVVRKTASSFDITLSFLKVDKACYIEVFRGKLEIVEVRVY